MVIKVEFTFTHISESSITETGAAPNTSARRFAGRQTVLIPSHEEYSGLSENIIRCLGNGKQLIMVNLVNSQPPPLLPKSNPQAEFYSLHE